VATSPPGAGPDPHDRVRELAHAIASLPLHAIDATLCRAVRTRHLENTPPEPLYWLASARVGARFTPLGGPAGLYLAADQTTAFAEIRDLFLGAGRRPLPLQPRDPVTLVYVRTSVGGILDLTDAGTRRRLRVGRDDVLAEWRPAMDAYLAGNGPIPLPQQLGLAAHLTSRVRGIWFKSARSRKGRCLVVFPDRLSAAAGDGVEAVDARGRYSQRIP
jgi:RES domain-containing protein